MVMDKTLTQKDYPKMGIYLGVKTCEVCLCFVGLGLGSIMLISLFSLFSLFYFTGERHRFLHRG